MTLGSLCVPTVFEVTFMGTLSLGFPQLVDSFVVGLIQIKTPFTETSSVAWKFCFLFDFLR